MNDFGHQIATQLRAADHVLIGAGAGLTAAAGIDYGDTEDFKRTFPVMYDEGFRARYQMIGRRGLDPERHWAFWATHLWDVRYRERRFPLYETLHELLAPHDTFVFTSNVDELFERHGMPHNRIYRPQGAYSGMQCRLPCIPRVWDSKPFVDAILDDLDPVTFRTSKRAIPRCPNCGGDMFMNVRIDRSMVDTPSEPGRRHLSDWLTRSTGTLVILEFGAGFNTPSVIRWPLERLASMRNATFFRINPQHHDVPEGGVSVPWGATETIAAWKAARAE